MNGLHDATNRELEYKSNRLVKEEEEIVNTTENGRSNKLSDPSLDHDRDEEMVKLCLTPMLEV